MQIESVLTGRAQATTIVVEVDDSTVTSGSKDKCPQWSTLKVVLEKMGVENPDPIMEGSIEWNLGEVRKLTKLQNLYFGYSRVVGDLSALRDLTELEELDLDTSGVVGELSLQRLIELNRLDLENTRVHGNLSSLKGLLKLTWLHLANTEVAGDLSDLRVLRLLKLYLRKTQVAGHLSSLESNRNLKVIDLSYTRVTGDLWSKKLQVLLLEKTQVASDLVRFWRLPQLEKLVLRQSRVFGDLSSLKHLDRLEWLDLSETQVSGRLSSQWRGHWSNLRILKLSRSQVTFLPQGEELLQLKSSYYTSTLSHSMTLLLPQLKLLDLNGCPLAGDVSDLLLPLCSLPVLDNIKAAGCQLSGTLPALKRRNVNLDQMKVMEWDPPLAKSLKFLNLASNNISEIDEIPDQMEFLMLAQNSALNFATGILRKVLASETYVDLQNEAKQLLHEGLMLTTSHITSTSSKGGFVCHLTIASTSLQITPYTFLPRELCTCLPGFEWKGELCSKCRSNTFSAGNGSTCVACPKGSFAGEGEATCRCTSGGKFRPDQSPFCQCPREHASAAVFESNYVNDAQAETCLPCHKAHLRCPKEGMLLSSAPPEIGFARLRANDTVALRCLPPKNTRCNSSDSDGSTHFGCASGYMGVLCSDCAAGHYLTNKICKACPTREVAQQIGRQITSVVSGLGMLAVILLAYLWLRRRHSRASNEVASLVEMVEMPGSGGSFPAASASSVSVPAFSARNALKEQFKRHAPILLETCQLWVVLAVLAKGKEGSRWEMPFIQALCWLGTGPRASQFSVDSLQGVLSLQCVFHAAAVRTAFALAAPLLPILVLLCCLAMEICRRGLGIAVALKAAPVEVLRKFSYA
eukprot:Skav235463  [mRNA]  locus=scaffold1451:70258:74668:+ [translate_table: standard]